MHYAKNTTIHTRPIRRTTDDDRIDQQVVEQEQEIRPSTTSRTQQIVYMLYGVVAGLLAIRFVFALLGANPLNPFANFVYTVTHPLVSPFLTLFGSGALAYKDARVEIGTLVAISVYGLIAWLIIRMVGIDKDAAHRDADI